MDNKYAGAGENRGSGTGHGEGRERDMFQAFDQAIEMMRIMNTFGDGAPGSPVSAASCGDMACAPWLNGMKAFLPYLDPRCRRSVSTLLKLLELKKLMESYGRRMIDMQAACGGDWRMGMLSAIRQHLPAEKQRQLDVMLNALSMMELMAGMRG